MRYFFYGTLLDADVRRLVLGRPVAGEPARLDGYRRIVTPGRTYPTLIAAVASVEGLLVTGVTPVQRTRLAAFEGRDYREAELIVCSSAGGESLARVFVPLRPPRAVVDWSFERWLRVDKPRFVRQLATSSAPIPARML